jgi:UDP-glucuronate 4-epimerase
MQSKMKILITGCAGFIGSHLCHRLCQRGDDVWGIDNLNDYYDPQIKLANLKDLEIYPHFHFLKDDLVTTHIMRQHSFDVVVHMGAMAGVRNSLQDPEIYMRTNVEGQIHLLKEAIQTNVKHYVYASSSSVYGCNIKIPFQEDDPLTSINSPYACSKLCMEQIAQLYFRLYNLPSIGLRFFTVYGPRGRPDMAPYKFLKSIMDQKPIEKFGDGETFRDYTYIDDIISGVVAAIDSRKISAEIYNLGNGQPITLNKFIEICERITHKKAIVHHLPEQLGDVPATLADISKAQKDLGYSPQVTFEEGIQKMFNSLF